MKEDMASFVALLREQARKRRRVNINSYLARRQNDTAEDGGAQKTKKKQGGTRSR